MKYGDLNDRLKKNMRRVFWLLFVLFFLLSVYFLKLIFVDSDGIITNTYNTRMKLMDENMKRGDIFDSQGNIIAESIKGEKGYARVYPYGRTLSHVTGYSDMGKAGIENKMNFALQRISMELLQRFNNLAMGHEIKANNAVLTVDADFSKYISDKLNGRKGAVVVMEPSTGKIISMVSYPDFDPESVAEDWNEIKNSTDSPLLNRAAQGLYIPGSTFKIMTAASMIENMTDWEDFTYECKGEAVFDGSKLVCFNSKAHGEVDLKSAFAVSCNLFFAEAALEMPVESKQKTVSDFYIDQPYNFTLDHAVGSYSLNESPETSETIETAIGQGKTLATPLNLAMAASAVANGGLMMEPYIVDRLESADSGSTIKKYLPQIMDQVLEAETADVLKDFMIACINEGTGAPASVKGVQVAGKTGTAQNPAGEDHSWFVGFAPADDPQIAFAILLENSGGGGKSVDLTKSILEYYFDK